MKRQLPTGAVFEGEFVEFANNPAVVHYEIDPQTASVAVRIRIALASRRNRALRRAVAAARRVV